MHADEIRARAVRLYAQGGTARAVGAKVGVDQRTVLRWVHSELGDARPRGPRRLPVTDEQIIELRDDVDMSWRAIAAAVGMSHSGVRSRYLLAMTGQRWR